MQPSSTTQDLFHYIQPSIYSTYSCCFHCSVRSVKSRISAMLENMPLDAWEESVKPTMILPILRRMSLFDPLRRMPIRWLDTEEAFPPQYIGNPDCLVTTRYWELCRMLRVGPEDSETFFVTFHALACNIMHIIIVREGHHIHPDNYMGLWHQVMVIGGSTDNIMGELRELISRARSGRRLKIEGAAQYIERCGAVEYALFLIRRMGSMLNKEDFRQRALDALCLAVIKGRTQHMAKLHTFRMALHPRSSGALVRTLGPDLMRMCLCGVETEKIVLWEGVLKKWLCAEDGDQKSGLSVPDVI